MTIPRRGDPRTWRCVAGAVTLSLLVVACGAESSSVTLTTFMGFDGCRAGAASVVAFMQRTLDEIDEAPATDRSRLVAEFDEGVHALLLRAQEVHCTEAGFNDAIIARVDDLEVRGPVGEALVAMVRDRGLGSLSESRGGPLRLPSG